MTTTIILHVANEEPILGEVDELPNPDDTLLVINNPRRKDGKDIHYIDSEVTVVIWPISKLAFLEVLPSESEEEIIGFVRE